MPGRAPGRGEGVKARGPGRKWPGQGLPGGLRAPLEPLISCAAVPAPEHLHWGEKGSPRPAAPAPHWASRSALGLGRVNPGLQWGHFLRLPGVPKKWRVRPTLWFRWRYGGDGDRTSHLLSPGGMRGILDPGCESTCGPSGKVLAAPYTWRGPREQAESGGPEVAFPGVTPWPLGQRAPSAGSLGWARPAPMRSRSRQLPPRGRVGIPQRGPGPAEAHGGPGGLGRRLL